MGVGTHLQKLRNSNHLLARLGRYASCKEDGCQAVGIQRTCNQSCIASEALPAFLSEATLLFTVARVARKHQQKVSQATSKGKEHGAERVRVAGQLRQIELLPYREPRLLVICAPVLRGWLCLDGKSLARLQTIGLLVDRICDGAALHQVAHQREETLRQLHRFGFRVLLLRTARQDLDKLSLAETPQILCVNPRATHRKGPTVVPCLQKVLLAQRTSHFTCVVPRAQNGHNCLAKHTLFSQHRKHVVDSDRQSRMVIKRWRFASGCKLQAQRGEVLLALLDGLFERCVSEETLAESQAVTLRKPQRAVLQEAVKAAG